MSYQRFATHNAVLPKAGPMAYPWTLDFTAVGEQVIDMEPEISANRIDFISGVFVDNSDNPAVLEIEVMSIGQVVKIPAGKQSYMPLLCTDAAQLTFRTTVNNLLHVPVFVLNFPVWPIIF
jgi:hypothetical protein